MDLNQFWRDFQERPLGYPILRAYDSFMNIKRYESMPFYFYPGGVSVSGLQDRVVKFFDWTVDAHEEARNNADRNRTFYERSVYFYKNFLRTQNDTMANMMFDAQAPRAMYDRLNSEMSQGNTQFYALATVIHCTSLAFMSFFFRYRRIGRLPTVAIAGAYWMYFSFSNNALYQLLVDRRVLATVRSDQRFHALAQPIGTHRPRNITYK